MALILMLTALYSVKSRRQTTHDFAFDMKELIQEAELIKKDLEAIMENSILVSDTMIQNLDERLERLESLAKLQVENREPSKPKVEDPYGQRQLPFSIADLRRAHPSIVVPRLFNDGYSVAEIAELLDRGQGEIRLILDIQKRREVGS